MSPAGSARWDGAGQRGRRQFQQTLFDSFPLIGFGRVTTSQSETGVVTGSITAADPERDPLEVRVVTGPANGTVTVDPITGDFSYTPNEGLAQSGGIDTFTVAVTVTELNADAHWHGAQDFVAAMSGGDPGQHRAGDGPRLRAPDRRYRTQR